MDHQAPKSQEIKVNKCTYIFWCLFRPLAHWFYCPVCPECCSTNCADASATSEFRSFFHCIKCEHYFSIDRKTSHGRN